MNKIKLLILVMVISTALVTCQPSGDLPDNDMPVDNAPIDNAPVDSEPGNVEPGQAENGGQPLPDNAQRGNVYIEDAQLLVMESYPVQVQLSLKGDLPTPCNQLQVDIAEPDAEHNIHADVYSLVDPDKMCTQVLKPFEQSFSIPMQGKEDGQYQVYVNDELVGEFSYPG